MEHSELNSTVSPWTQWQGSWQGRGVWDRKERTGGERERIGWGHQIKKSRSFFLEILLKYMKIKNKIIIIKFWKRHTCVIYLLERVWGWFKVALQYFCPMITEQDVLCYAPFVVLHAHLYLSHPILFFSIHSPLFSSLLSSIPTHSFYLFLLSSSSFLFLYSLRMFLSCLNLHQYRLYKNQL